MTSAAMWSANVSVSSMRGKATFLKDDVSVATIFVVVAIDMQSKYSREERRADD